MNILSADEEEHLSCFCLIIYRDDGFDQIFDVSGLCCPPCVSDLAQHYLMKANITAIRRVRKTDNNRIAR